MTVHLGDLIAFFAKSYNSTKGYFVSLCGVERCANSRHFPLILTNFPLVLTNSSINPIGLLMHFSRIRFNEKIRCVNSGRFTIFPTNFPLVLKNFLIPPIVLLLQFRRTVFNG